MARKREKKRPKVEVRREDRFRFLQGDRDTLWYLLPPPHPLAGLYSGPKPLRRAGVHSPPPCPVPEEERRGFARALEAWYRRYREPPAVGVGEALYRPGAYPRELRELVLPDSGVRAPVRVRADGSKARKGGFGAVALGEKGLLGSLQGGLAAEEAASSHLELLALVHALVLGLALNRPFAAETDSKGLVERLNHTEKESTPLERAARALMGVAREAGLFRGLRHLPREGNGEAHRLANGGRRTLEEKRDPLEAFLLALPLAYRAWGLRYLRRLAPLGGKALEALARWKGETARALLEAAREDPEGFAQALEGARGLSEEEAEARAKRLLVESLEGLPPTPKQVAFLKARGVDPTGMTRAEASRWIRKIEGG